MYGRLLSLETQTHTHTHTWLCALCRAIVWASLHLAPHQLLLLFCFFPLTSAKQPHLTPQPKGRNCPPPTPRLPCPGLCISAVWLHYPQGGGRSLSSDFSIPAHGHFLHCCSSCFISSGHDGGNRA